MISRLFVQVDFTYISFVSYRLTTKRYCRLTLYRLQADYRGSGKTDVGAGAAGTAGTGRFVVTQADPALESSNTILQITSLPGL